MGIESDPAAVMFFCAFMYRSHLHCENILDWFAPHWGSPLLRTEPIPFSFSPYYHREMGPSLHKVYCVYGPPFPREQLVARKRRSNTIEREHADAQGGGRVVNADPGYISRDKLVLATTKDFAHRIYLGEGIFGEVTLHFSRQRCRHFSWTYPDYRQAQVQELVLAGRNLLDGAPSR